MNTLSIAALGQWYRAREPRERRVLAIAAVAVPVLVLYATVWDPLMSSREQLGRQLPDLRQTAARFALQADEVERLRKRTPAQDSRRSPRIAIEQSAGRMNIALRGVESGTADRTIVQLGVVPFDMLSRWLGDLASSEGLSVESLQLTAAGPGQVRVDRLILLPAARRSPSAPAGRS
jgi:general secretion pathway protein M